MDTGPLIYRQGLVLYTNIHLFCIYTGLLIYRQGLVLYTNINMSYGYIHIQGCLYTGRDRYRIKERGRGVLGDSKVNYRALLG